MTPKRALIIAREVFPNTGDDDLWGMLWEHTGFPSFFLGDPETRVRSQLERYKDGKCNCPECDDDTRASVMVPEAE